MIANGFRHPFGNGVYTPEIDGDGFYVWYPYDLPRSTFNGYHHRAEDWSFEYLDAANVPLVSPGHGTVLDVGSTDSHGNYIVISHQLPYSIVYDGYETDSITTVHLHLTRLASYANGESLAIGDTLEAGEQFGLMGATGYSGGVIHNHFELRLDGDLPLRGGYEPGPVDLPWVNPTDFILAHRYMGAVTGTDAADAISANVGSDSVTGGFGADTLSGAGGGDLLYGNQDADFLVGGDSVDTLFGGQDADTAEGGDDDDLIYGNRGGDSLAGGDGDDTLYGGQDADALFGDAGSDLMIGGLGSDTFHVSGADTVTDFNGAAGDRVSAGSALSGFTDTETGTLAGFADGGSVLLSGVAASALSADWFLIA